MEYENAYKGILKLAQRAQINLLFLNTSGHSLGKVRDHEDVMALQGRLYKDLFLSQSGKEAQDTAGFSLYP